MKTKNTLWAAGAVLVLSLSAFAQNVKHDAVAQPAAEKTADCGDPPTARPVRRTDGWWAKGVPERHLAAIAANKSGHFDLVMVGDSITHRWMQKDKGGAETWPQLTNEFSVLNLGIGADRTQHVLWRLLHGELDGYTADVFTLLIGVNNTGTDSAEDIAEGTRRIVALIREKHPESTILLIPILPHGKNPSDPGSTTARANSITRALADGDKVRIFDIRNKFLGPDGKLLPGMMAADDLHPIEGGYRVWYDSLVPEVRKLMGRPGGGFAMRVSGPRPIPRPALLRRLKCGPEVIGIVHWGLNTYTDREWGFGDENPELLNPDSFDAEQIVGACAAGGLGGLVVVAKHHDGFCLWPTRTTDHNIAKSPFRDGKGDYVKEMERACRKFGIKFGVYVSPWDRNNSDYGSAAYVETYHAQIKELLNGDYGEIFEMWFDNANGGDGFYGGAREKRQIPVGYYRFDEVFRFVRCLQPSVCIFNEDDGADFRWPGNEKGILNPECRATGRHFDISRYQDYMSWAGVGTVEGTVFHPPEADFPLRTGWFYHSEDSTKDGATLLRRYMDSVGRGGTMNIGIAPDKSGRLSETDVRALVDFNRLRKRLFQHEVAGDGELFNFIDLREDVSNGEQVDGWQLVSDGKVVAQGKSIGIRRMRLLDDPVKSGKCELKVTAAAGHVKCVSFRRYLLSDDLVRLLRAKGVEEETETAKRMMKSR